MPRYSSEKKKQKASKKRLVLGCGALAHEMMALVGQSDEVKEVIDIHCLPAHLHHRPNLISPEVDKYLTDHAQEYAEVYVAYGDCGTAGELDKVLLKHNAERIPGEHCFEFLSSKSVYDDFMEEELGSFFLTDFMVRQFQRFVIEGLGLDRYPELFDEYFKHYKRMIYIAQTEDPDLQELAKQHAASFGMEYVYRYVGMQGMQSITEYSIENLKNQKTPIKVEVNNA